MQKYQKEIDDISDYPQRVDAAKTNFTRYNRPNIEPFKTVRKILATLCCGAQRCMYCEDSCADEVEHFKPKDLYPEVCFVWENYLYSCGRCNVPKNNQFAVFTRSPRQLLEVARQRNAPVLPPPPGDCVLINPRHEDPLDFLELNLETGIFLPKGRRNSRKYQRADYTIRTLKLNERPELPAARKSAYLSYLARLEQYVRHKLEGADTTQLERFVHAIQRMEHPTVWKEMQRQAILMPELERWFHLAPEAYYW